MTKSIIIEIFIWLEPIWILLFGIFVLLPGKWLPIDGYPYLLCFLFAFNSLRLIQYRQTGQTTSTVNPSFQMFASSPLQMLVCLLSAWLPVTLWASANRPTSWIAIGYLLFGIMLYLSLVNWPVSRRYPELVVWGFIVVIIALVVVAIPLVVWKPEFRLFYLPLYEYLPRLTLNIGETIHANVLAGVLVLILPLLLALTSQKLYRTLFIFFLLLTASILVLTQSRGGYLAVAIALSVVVILRWPRSLYGLLPAAIVVIFLVQQIDIQSLLDQLSMDGSLGGWKGRLDIWVNSLQAVADFAFTGIGIGTFTLVMPLLYPVQVSVEDYPHAHNLFLQIALDLGLPGLIAYLALVINLFVMLISTLQNPHTLPLHRTLAIGAAGSLVGMLVHGLLDAVTWGTKLAFVPWLLFALITQLFLYTQATQAAYKAAAALQSNTDAGK